MIEKIEALLKEKIEEMSNNLKDENCNDIKHHDYSIERDTYKKILNLIIDLQTNSTNPQTLARLVECTDYDNQYGIIRVNNATVSEVQNKIYEIKGKFEDEEFDDWCIDDVLENFPDEWDWEFDGCDADDTIEI